MQKYNEKMRHNKVSNFYKICKNQSFGSSAEMSARVQMKKFYREYYQEVGVQSDTGAECG